MEKLKYKKLEVIQPRIKKTNSNLQLVNKPHGSARNAVPFQSCSLIGSIRASGSDCTDYG